MNPSWLPALITLEGCGGDWDVYLRQMHEYFRADFIESAPLFDGQRVAIRRFLEAGKEACFWHLISEGKADERLPNLRRCERIRWIRPVIENSKDPAVRTGENERRGERNACLWLHEMDYLVVLGRRKGYTLLLTAYHVHDHQKERFLKEFQRYSQNG